MRSSDVVHLHRGLVLAPCCCYITLVVLPGVELGIWCSQGVYKSRSGHVYPTYMRIVCPSTVIYSKYVEMPRHYIVGLKFNSIYTPN